MVPTFLSFPVINRKGHFRNILTGFSSLAAFLGFMPTFVKEMSQLPYTEFNAESIDTSFKFEKRKREKLDALF